MAEGGSGSGYRAGQGKGMPGRMVIYERDDIWCGTSPNGSYTARFLKRVPFRLRGPGRVARRRVVGYPLTRGKVRDI